MYPIPTVLTFSMALAVLAAGSAHAAPAAKAAADSAKAASAPAPAAKAPAVPPPPATPAVLRASGTTAPAGSTETLDTASSEEGDALPQLQSGAAPAAQPAAPADPAATMPAPKNPPARDTVKRVEEPALLEAAGLTRLQLGGTFQLKAYYHDISASDDKDKSLSFQMRRARIDLAGGVGEKFAFEGQFRLEANGRQLGSEAVYLAYKFNDLIGIKGGKLKRPFSFESMQSSKSLYTVERGTLYQAFLAETNGYSSYDLGVVFHGGFVDEGVPVTYEVGVFNGRQAPDSAAGYKDQHYTETDAGFKAKDLAFRLVAQPFHPLKVEAAVSTKAAEDRSNPADFNYQVNTAYEVGAELTVGRLRVLGEAAWGDNHQGRDSRIISGVAPFFAFYGMAVWHEDYSRGRASEMVIKMEGLDPDFSDDATNDGKFRYTLGCNYFFNPKVSILVDYGVTQPVTKLPGEDELTHDIDAMWRISF